MPTKNTDWLIASRFEERAENLSKEELEEWTAPTSNDRSIISKLKGPGAKLLTGPRGSGKSTFFRKAYYELTESREALAVYVNYARSLALEPLFHTRANAPQIFRQWVLMKIVKGANETFEEMGIPQPDTLERLANQANELIQRLETGQTELNLEKLLAPSQVLHLLETWAQVVGATRCVLLLDDAAHAFSLEQQRDFFEIFRELRSRRVSAKAAVYPGITSYSPTFNVGHEAETLEAWIKVEDRDFLKLMQEIVERRLTSELREQLTEEYINLLALASFGLPRGFLNMLSQLLRLDESSSPQTPTRPLALRAISEHADSVRGIFRSLSAKLPRFKYFIEVGNELDGAMWSTVQEYNRTKEVRKKAVTIAISEPIPQELDRILKFMEYAGLVRKQGSVSRGVKGTFQRFIIHYSVLISENALSLGQTFSIGDLIDALISRDPHAYVRTRATALLGKDFHERCVLDLPPCQTCGSARVSQDQRFCMKCGSELGTSSVYEELLKATIDNLPLTSNKRKGIEEHTTIRTVQDILLDDDRELMKVPYIGEIWGRRIKNYAEEFVSV